MGQQQQATKWTQLSLQVKSLQPPPTLLLLSMPSTSPPLRPYTQVQAAANHLLWDDAAGAFIDNPSTTLHPQDGNSLAVLYGLVFADRASRISDHLAKNWNAVGSRTPEWNYDIGTFPGSLEVMAHAQAGKCLRALQLMRLQWGYMLNHPNSTQSTFWEGYHSDGSFAYQGVCVLLPLARARHNEPNAPQALT